MRVLGSKLRHWVVKIFKEVYGLGKKGKMINTYG